MADAIFQKAWAHYLDLLDFLAGNPAKIDGVLQPYNLATLLSYSQSAQNYNVFLALNMCNYVAPTTPFLDNTAQFSESVPNFPSRLDEVYISFLQEFDDILLNALDPSEQVDYSKLEGKFQDAQTRYNDYQVFVDQEWMRYVAAHPEIPAEELPAERRIFERDRGYSAELQRRRAVIKTWSGKMNAFLRKNTPKELWTIIDAKAYLEDENFQVRLPTFPQFDSPTKKDLWEFFPTQNPVFDLDEFLTNDNFVTRKFKTVDGSYSKVETKWSVSAKGKWGLFGGSASAEGRKMEEITNRTEFEFEVGFKRLQEVEIFRHKWYQDKLFGTLGKQFSQYWGPNGSMAVIPYSLIFARGTKISVKISEEFRRALEKFFKAGGSMSWGGFVSAGGSYSKDEKYLWYKETDDGFTLEDNEATVRVLGARVRRFNWSSEQAKEYFDGVTDEKVDGMMKVLARDGS